jgi:hypothetical protein
MFRTTFACILTAAVLAGPAGATVIGGAITGGSALTGGGVFIKLTAPFTESNPDSTVGDDNFQTPNLYAFDENQNLTIPSEIMVDVGTNPQAGDIVASHYIVFDPGPTTSMSGWVEFDAPIFGVATQTGTLAASDFLFVSGLVTYENPGARGLESSGMNEIVQIDSMNPNRLNLINWRASSPGDVVRVFTMESPGAVVPLPAAGWLLLSGVGALAALRRRA